MKYYLLSVVVLALAALFFRKAPAEPVPVVMEAATEVVETPLPEPILDRVVLEDSVMVWVDGIADLRPSRPYRPGDEIPFEPNEITEDGREKPIAVSWRILIDIEYVLTYNKELDMEVYAPIFPDTLKSLSGKLVSIRGYIIPFDDSQETVALSANPYAACFFCGKASPASVLTLRFAKPGKQYQLDARRTFTGRLRLNYDDPEEFYYVLDDAREK
ncbi:MAG: hypothetical protein AAFZ52_11825 [Bacteroidota bacterium]